MIGKCLHTALEPEDDVVALNPLKQSMNLHSALPPPHPNIQGKNVKGGGGGKQQNYHSEGYYQLPRGQCKCLTYVTMETD